MYLAIALLIVGFAILIKGADFLVEGASSLAKRLRIPEIVIGLTVVAFGTSAPELVVNIIASVRGNNEMVLGNIIGSNIFNTMLILGIAGMIYPLQVQRNSVKKEIPFSLFAAVVFFCLANDNLFFKFRLPILSTFDGVILFSLFLLFIYYTFILSRVKTVGEIEEIEIFPTWKIVLYLLLGFLGLFIGGKLVVENAVYMTRALHVSEKLIALTVVSMGTSLPELAATGVAAYKKRSDLAFGNVIGSNLFNVLLVLGVSSAISPVPYTPALNVDLVVFMAATIWVLMATFFGKVHRLDRWQSLVLLFFYVLYMFYVFIRL